MTTAPYTIASKDTDGTNETYKYMGTNSYGNATGAADPGTHWLNLTEPNQNEVQLVTLTAGVFTLGDTFTLTFQGQTTTPIAYDATTATVSAALVALSNIAPGDVNVTGIPAAWRVEFKGNFVNTNVETMIPNGSNLTGGGARIKVTTIQTPHSARARVYPFSFFDSNHDPTLVTNPLHTPLDGQATGAGIYIFQDFPLLFSPTFALFNAQQKLLGPTLTGVPDEAKDSQHIDTMAPVDGGRRYGIVFQMWDQFRTGRQSLVSKPIEITAKVIGVEPFRAPAFDLKQISGNTGSADASSLYSVASGYRCSFLGIEVIYNSDRFDSVIVYRTVADNPKGPLSLDGVFKLTGKYTTLNQRKAASTDLPSPWKRAFIFTQIPESQIAQQPSFDSSSFLMEPDLPKAGAAILLESTVLLGNVGPVDQDVSGMGVVRWSSTTKHAIESVSPLALYAL
jgi:hypothetical protein